MANKQKAVFFDRDGVLNHLIKRNGSYYSPQKFDDFKIVENAKHIIDDVHSKGYLAIIISNQPDITRGNLKQTELDKMSDLLYSKLNVDDIFYCTHDDYNDEGCRKPAPGLIFKAKELYNIDLSRSYMIGDTWKDVEAANSASLPFFLIDKDYNKDLMNVRRINTLRDMINSI